MVSSDRARDICRGTINIDKYFCIRFFLRFIWRYHYTVKVVVLNATITGLLYKFVTISWVKHVLGQT